jgi:hypothetical protein
MSENSMIRFSLEFTPAGTWAWRTYDLEGRNTASGVAATKKVAAALIIRHIVDRVCERPAVLAEAA